MKKYVSIIVTISILMSLCGCSNNTGENKTNENSPAFNIHVTTDKNARISIPNPETYDDNSEIILVDCKILDWSGSGKEKLLYADLSFAGLGDVKVTDFAIGNVTSAESAHAEVRYSFTKKRYQRMAAKLGQYDRSVVGGCLVLSASEIVDDEDDTMEGMHYIVLLDYVNKKYYVQETDLFNSFVEVPSVKLADLTGDGLDDVIVSNYRRKYRLRCEVYRFNQGGLKQIYNSNWTERYKTQDEYFSGYLIDNYKAVIECKSIGYKRKTSLLECGYQEKDLDVSLLKLGESYQPPDDVMIFTRAYNKGALRKGYKYKGVWIHWVNIHVLPINYPDGVQLYDTGLGMSLKLKHGVYFGKWNLIGYGYTYMKYNPESDWIEIVAAEFEENYEL